MQNAKKLDYWMRFFSISLQCCMPNICIKVISMSTWSTRMSRSGAKEIDYSFDFLSLFLSHCHYSSSSAPIAFDNKAKNGMCSTKICLVTTFIQFKKIWFSTYSTWEPRLVETSNEKRKKETAVSLWILDMQAHLKSEISIEISMKIKLADRRNTNE